MHLIAALSLSLITTTLANPLASPSRFTVDSALAQTCSILSNSVNCRFHPNTGSTVEHVFNQGNTASFTCWQYGTCVSGGCTGETASCGSGNCDVWDYNPTYDCFVSAHYTSSACTTSSLPRCGFSKE